VAAVRDAGFRYAFTGDPGTFSERTDPLRIPRLAVDGSIYSIGGRFSWSFFEARMLGALGATPQDQPEDAPSPGS
jgi:hypothetical protein